MEEPVESPREAALRRLHQGDAEGAIRDLHALLERDPHDAQALGYLGVAYARKGELPHSVNALQRACNLAPGDADLAYNLAVACHQSGRREEARYAAERTLALRPSHGGARLLLEGERQAGDVPARAAALPVAPSWSLAGAGLSVPAGVAHGPAQGTASGQAGAEAPSELGRRLLRGWLWGALYGQFWTVCLMFWLCFSLGSKLGAPWMVLSTLLVSVLFATCGSGIGVVVALTRARLKGALAIALAVGAGLFLLEWALQLGHPINIFFWFFTSRFVGEGIHGKVMGPVAP